MEPAADRKDKYKDPTHHSILDKQYVEVSAKNTDAVDDLFRQLLGKVINNPELKERILMDNQADKMRLNSLGVKRRSRANQKGKDPDFDFER